MGTSLIKCSWLYAHNHAKNTLTESITNATAIHMVPEAKTPKACKCSKRLGYQPSTITRHTGSRALNKHITPWNIAENVVLFNMLK